MARDLTLPATWPIGDYKVVIEVTDNRSGAAVKKEIARSLEGAARMRAALPLANGDQPVTLFSARVRR